MFRHGKRSRDAYFTILFRRTSSNTPRLGLAVGRKHCRLATKRNRIKRLVRESFRTHKSQLQGLDIVVMITRATPGAANRTLLTSLDRHWRRLADAAGTAGRP